MCILPCYGGNICVETCPGVFPVPLESLPLKYWNAVSCLLLLLLLQYLLLSFSHSSIFINLPYTRIVMGKTQLELCFVFHGLQINLSSNGHCR